MAVHLVTTFGFPGSGKTYFSQRFAAEMGWMHLNSDRMRLGLFAQPTHLPDETQVVFAQLDRRAQELLQKHQSVIYDANMSRAEHRRRLAAIATQAGADFLALWVQTPLELAKARISERQLTDWGENQDMYRVVSHEVVHQIKDSIESPTADESCLILNGELIYEELRNAVLARLDEIIPNPVAG